MTIFLQHNIIFLLTITDTQRGVEMSKFKKALFIIILTVFVGASVWMTFNSVSRDTFEYDYVEDINGEGFSGWVFDGFNGNQTTEEIHIDFVTDKDGNNPDTTKPIAAVSDYTLVSDEYVKYIYIGESVRYIDERAFFYCKQLRGIYVDENNPYYTDVDGILFTKDMKTMLLYPICRCTQIVYDDIKQYGEVKNIGLDLKETITVSGGDTQSMYLDFKGKVSDDISSDMFAEMLENGVTAPYIGTYYILRERTENTLTIEKAWSCDEVYTIPESVERIGDNCFYKCDRLQRIDIPSVTKEIGNMAFFKCYGISLVTLPDGLESIGDDAFSYCENMRYSIYIPSTVKSVGHHCFYQCDALERFYLGAASEDDINLGGSWQPKKENSFKADPPTVAATRQDSESYNLQRAAEETPTQVVEVIDTEQPEEKTGIDAFMAKFERDGTNYFAVVLMIIFIFIPSFTFVLVDVIRKMFKEDFLMSKRKKEKLRMKKEENERIKKEYYEKLAKEKEEGGEG